MRFWRIAGRYIVIFLVLHFITLITSALFSSDSVEYSGVLTQIAFLILYIGSAIVVLIYEIVRLLKNKQ